MFPEARCLSAEDLRVGLTAEYERDIAESDILDFARNSGDGNPLHVDPAYAESTTYGRRIVHGAFQVGLASAMAGMYLPGRKVLLGSITARFPSPLYFPSRVKVFGQVTSWDLPSLRGNLKVSISEAASGVTTGEVSLGFTFHEAAKPQAGSCGRQTAPGAAAEKKLVLVSGASGGLGSAVAAALCASGEYHVIALVNRTPLDPLLKSDPNVTEVGIDLGDDHWSEAVESVLGDAPVYGAVHAAWAGMPKGGLLNTRDEVILNQLAFGALHTVRLARLVFARATPQGGRLVLLGSIAGTHNPLPAAAAYSLGKAALEHTLRLLAPELARKCVTVNAVCPSFVPVGMNRHSTERQRLGEASSIPLGRLCEAQDVVSAVRFLLSPEASFISGQVIGLSGGKL